LGLAKAIQAVCFVVRDYTAPAGEEADVVSPQEVEGGERTWRTGEAVEWVKKRGIVKNCVSTMAALPRVAGTRRCPLWT